MRTSFMVVVLVALLTLMGSVESASAAAASGSVGCVRTQYPHCLCGRLDMLGVLVAGG